MYHKLKPFPLLPNDRYMIDRCRPCILNRNCLAKDIMYFSFIVPLQSQIVVDFAIGCAKGQSLFVAVEKRCNCLIWASIPFNTILSSYCLFEVLIDKNNGGKFNSCQNVLDNLFQNFKLCNKYSLNRIPYGICRTSHNIHKENFISTLKNVFNVRNLCDLNDVSQTDIENFREDYLSALKHTLVPNAQKLRIPNHFASYKDKKDCDEFLAKKHNIIEKMPDIQIMLKKRKHTEIALPNLERCKENKIPRRNLETQKIVTQKLPSTPTAIFSKSQEISLSTVNQMVKSQPKEKITSSIIANKDQISSNSPIQHDEISESTVKNMKADDGESINKMETFQTKNKKLKQAQIGYDHENETEEKSIKVEDHKNETIENFTKAEDHENEIENFTKLEDHENETIENFNKMDDEGSVKANYHDRRTVSKRDNSKDCSSTSNTEQFLSQKLLSELEVLEINERQGLFSCTDQNESNNCHMTLFDNLIQEWNLKLTNTIETYVRRNIF